MTEDNTTVLLSTIKSENSKRILEIKKIIENENTFYQKIEQVLEEKAINLLKYESGIISGKMEDIWNLVLDFNQLAIIAPNNNYLPNINLKTLKTNEEVKVSVLEENEINSINIILRLKDEKPEWNKWLIVFEASGGFPKKIPRHTALLQLTKVNNYECQFRN